MEIKIDDRETVRVLRRLQQQGTRLKPAMQDIGEYLVHSTKQRFATSTAPDGTPWAPNSETTLINMLRKRGGLSKRRTKTGGRTLTKKGQARLAAKKPLVGESRRLGNEIHYRATNEGVEVGSALEYATTQQFGAEKGSFTGGKTPWGDIPARPFLGVSEADRAQILAILREHYETGQRG